MHAGYSLREICDRFGGVVIGDDSVRIKRVSSLEGANQDSLAFLTTTNAKYAKLATVTRASAVIVDQSGIAATTLPRIVANEPSIYFAQVAAWLNPPPQPEPGIHVTAYVHESVSINETVTIGSHCTVGKRVSLGQHVVIEAGCILGEGVTIGDHTHLMPKVVVYHGCQIGSGCIIHAGTVIGADGFGYIESNHTWVKVPQIGKVIIGNQVEIGAGTTIDRGTLDDTVIGSGVKIDNLVHIAHNCHIGENTAIAACAGIAGSARIGKHCRIGGAAMIAGHLTIADGVTVSPGTMIPKSLPEKTTYTGLMPFLNHENWLKTAAYIRHLPRLSARINALEAQLKALVKGKL